MVQVKAAYAAQTAAPSAFLAMRSATGNVSFARRAARSAKVIAPVAFPNEPAATWFASLARISAPPAPCSHRLHSALRNSQLKPTLPPTVPGQPRIVPLVREASRVIRKLIPVVRDAVRGQNSTVWGLRKAEKAGFRQARRY
ncbi:MAG TPA: hypothetical protein VFC17_13745 [Candidatus Limnocylindrales bacterium]|nr:hypothetical protein [Candidatus Limnocylindrales bacterium]